MRLRGGLGTPDSLGFLHVSGVASCPICPFQQLLPLLCSCFCLMPSPCWPEGRLEGSTDWRQWGHLWPNGTEEDTGTDCFDYLQSLKDFSQLTWMPPVKEADENRNRRGPCLSFPREEPSLQAATAPSCAGGQEENNRARGRSAGPRESREERGEAPQTWAAAGPESWLSPALLHSWSEAGFWAGIFWEPKDAGSGGQLGVALDLCFPCYSFCLSLDLLFSGKQASGPLILSLSP